MTLLITGAGGQLGHELLAAASVVGIPIQGLTHADLDVTDRKAVLEAVREAAGHAGVWRAGSVSGPNDPVRLTAILHAAAYTAVDEAESNWEAAFHVNRDGAAHVAEAAAVVGVPMIYFSTDYVFSGEGKRPWREQDPTGPINVYGASKLAGEKAVAEWQPRHIILRTSWVFGAYGANFVRTVLRLAAEREELRVVTDQQGGPTPAGDLAYAALEIAQIVGAWRVEAAPWGVYHLAGRPPVAWFDFAAAIMDAIGTRQVASPCLVPVSSADVDYPARRPRNSVLDCSKIGRTFGVEPPDWRAKLRGVVQEIENATGTNGART